ncbi:3'-5' exonuclease [Arcanobacterium hippocoleae]
MPEIRALRSLLQLSVSTTRNDCLVYLFNYFALGSADIHAFASLRKQIARADRDKNESDFPVQVNLLQVLELFVQTQNPDGIQLQSEQEAAGELTAAHKIRAAAEQSLSAESIRRIEYIAEAVLQLRNNTYLPLPVLIRKAAAFLQLPVLIASRPTGQAKVLGALNLFTQMSVEYSAAGRGKDLNGFLKWIDEVEARERVGQENPGDDLALVEILDEKAEIPGKVTILTVHAAKGLQWDVVAIPEMVENKFDDKTSRGLQPWHKNNSKLPDTLRADAEHIPFISIQDIEFQSDDLKLCKGEAGCRYYDYLNRKLVKYYSDEQRRLAYVAFTRPKYSLILGSYDCASVKRAKQLLEKNAAGNKGRRWAPLQLSTFLAELLPPKKDKNTTDTQKVKYCVPDPDNDPLLTDETKFKRWAEQFQNSQTEAEQVNTSQYWPRDLDRTLAEPDMGDFQISDKHSEQILTEVRENLALLQKTALENTEQKMKLHISLHLESLR